MSHFVQIRIKLWVRFLPIGCARDDRIHTSFFTQLSNFLRIITFISYKMPSSPYFFNDFSCNFTVVDLPPSDFKIDRISMRISGNMYLCCVRQANSSFFSPPSSTRMLMSPYITCVGEDPFFINFSS